MIVSKNGCKNVNNCLDKGMKLDIIQNANNLQKQSVCIFICEKGQDSDVTHFRTYIRTYNCGYTRVIAIFICYLSSDGINGALCRK